MRAYGGLKVQLIKQGGDEYGLWSRILGIDFGISQGECSILPIYEALNIDPALCRNFPFDSSSLAPKSSAKDLIYADMGAVLFDSAGIFDLVKAEEAERILRDTQLVLPNHIGGGWNSRQWWLVVNMGLASWIKAVFIPAVVNGEILIFLTQNQCQPSLMILLEKEIEMIKPHLCRHFEQAMVGAYPG